MDLKRDMHKDEVETALKNKGEFVQIDWLTRYLKLMPPIEMRKYAYLKLAQIYEAKKLFSDAARMYRNMALNSKGIKDKIENLNKETEAWIKAGDFFEADKSLKAAMEESTFKERDIIYANVLKLYKSSAEMLEKEMKRNQASKYYEKLLNMNVPENEKEFIKTKLAEIYSKLGKVRDMAFINRNEEIARKRRLF